MTDSVTIDCIRLLALLAITSDHCTNCLGGERGREGEGVGGKRREGMDGGREGGRAVKAEEESGEGERGEGGE